MDRMIFTGDGIHRADNGTRGIFAMAALDGHCGSLGDGDEQARVSLQSHLLVAFYTGCLAGKAPYAAPGIGNNKPVHGATKRIRFVLILAPFFI
jgi:hypothetical protein